jgi:hypothetical protein
MKNIINSERSIMKDITPAEPFEGYVGFVYLWKCVPEERYYIGSHKGNVYDNYRGSGSKFKKAFDFHGSQKFERIILEYVKDESELKQRERHYIMKYSASTSKKFYNCRLA